MHGHHGSNRRELAQHAHSSGSQAFHSHTDINTVTTTLCEAPVQLLQNLESIFSFEGTWGRGGKTECPEKTLARLPANRYHMLEEKIQRPGRSPANIGDKLARPRARTASDPLSYKLMHAHTHARTHAHTHTHTHTQWHIHTCTNTLFNAYPVLSLFSFLFLKKKAESTYLWLQVVCVHSTLLKEAKRNLDTAFI